LVDNLNRNVMASWKALEPGNDWTTWQLGDRVFRVSPDRKKARELRPDGYRQIVVKDFVLEKTQEAAREIAHIPSYFVPKGTMDD
jgi:hypothetical protein